MSYQPNETITLRSEVTRDQAPDLDNIVTKVSIMSNRGVLVASSDMIIDLDSSTADKKVFVYKYTIPANVRGAVSWWVNVTGPSGYNTIEKSTFIVE